MLNSFTQMYLCSAFAIPIAYSSASFLQVPSININEHQKVATRVANEAIICTALQASAPKQHYQLLFFLAESGDGHLPDVRFLAASSFASITV